MDTEIDTEQTEPRDLQQEEQTPEISRERRLAEIDLLRRFVTPRRQERMDQVLSSRTRHITVAVEDIFQPHNGSAILRSCDAFGVQDVHIIENRNRYRINPGVELGTSQWLSVHRYGLSCTEPAGPAKPVDPGEPPRATRACIQALRARGYRIVATTPHRKDVTPRELSLEKGPLALLFGTEKEGLTETALAEADEYLRIPMVGFVESLNISVSAAVTLHTLTERLRESTLPWQISGEERERILHRWLFGSVRHAREIISQELPSGQDRL
ncbi:tRNA (guanosine-2'-O-)-methyltransferase [Alkalispirochaeta americana]|uniref:tRNA (guanosine(18)-2'-O)-methyltransferase n=1 Tax=Alkalispirochaeta americana TaxID=159291 RepID=A0A1N6RAS6_9SPIO|nr:RNA methyltransferase [Alkalispirochaeta americana]SIQ25907.1 tRNA (guanosine-2'-O-)-methyltransferase [Alkalispirochaeta americana]